MTVIDRAAEKVEPPLAASEDAVHIYLFPGQIVTTSEPAMISTILGSCVAVCMWDPEAGIGGMNHFLLPDNPSPGSSDGRYGNTAMACLLEQLLDRGASAGRLLAKIVGGASVLGGLPRSRRSIGEQNVAAAREFLRKLDVVVTGDQTGGRRGRKLLFHTGTGSAYVKEIGA